MPGRLNVADIQGKSPDFKVQLEDDTLLEINGELILNNQSFIIIDIAQTLHFTLKPTQQGGRQLLNLISLVVNQVMR